MPADNDHKGLFRLMLKMPALRGRLQVLSIRDPEVLSLCGAFEDASSTLEFHLNENHPTNRDRIQEYQMICREIEDDIIGLCLKHGD
jgi:hypothetical protein